MEDSKYFLMNKKFLYLIAFLSLLNCAIAIIRCTKEDTKKEIKEIEKEEKSSKKDLKIDKSRSEIKQNIKKLLFTINSRMRQNAKKDKKYKIGNFKEIKTVVTKYPLSDIMQLYFYETKETAVKKLEEMLFDKPEAPLVKVYLSRLYAEMGNKERAFDLTYQLIDNVVENNVSYPFLHLASLCRILNDKECLEDIKEEYQIYFEKDIEFEKALDDAFVKKLAIF